ncbi:hypothetical protein ALQ96_101521 [Pseudomonas syringae pv. atrofaciens]|nr:hypothetical protein ALQ96_101521 [Pseudomonas syringae pv. atrofaciens]
MNQRVAKRVTGHHSQTYVDCRARYRRILSIQSGHCLHRTNA